MTVISELEAKRSGGNPASQVREISIAHSPDSDDAFMFYGLATNKVRVGGHELHAYALRHRDVEPAGDSRSFFDVTAISFHVYPYIQEQYALMSCGGSWGRATGR